MPKVSVIVVDYNNLEFTKLCLKSLYQTTLKDKEIIVIDNGSGGKARKFYYDQMTKDKITFFDYYQNMGLAVAANKGASLACGKYLFFLNNDTIVKRDIFDHLLKSPYDITGCRMFDYKGKRDLSSRLSVDRFGCPAGETGPMFYPDGAIFIKKEVFDELGGFDEKLFLYGEDRDLCWRGWLSGYHTGFSHNAVFFHNSSCVDRTNYFRRMVSEQNIIRSFIKNYTGRSLARIIPQYIFWSILELGYILFTKPQAIWKSYLPAYWWNIINLKDTLKEHKRVIRRVADKDIPFSRKIGKLESLRKGVKWGKKRYS